MIKFTATNKWYERAAKSETDILDISSGSSALCVSGSEPIRNIKKIRKLEGFSIRKKPS